MNVTSDLIKITITRWFRITGEPPIVPMLHSLTGKKFEVTDGKIEYAWRDGRWILANDWAIEVTGNVLKKDGTPGLNSHIRRGPDTSRFGGEEPWPWLDTIVDLLRPDGDLNLPALTDHEV